MSALFISFEGSEGCGKSTQIERLGNRLDAAGQSCLIVREPGGTLLGEAVREVLLRHATGDEAMTPRAELLLFAASRAQLVRKKIIPALEAGTHVIADRFLDSTTVYQGFGRGLDLIAVSQINAFAVGACHPHLTFLLDMDADKAHARALERSGGRPDRMESEPPEFYERVRDGYLQVAHENPRRIVTLDADEAPDVLAERIWIEVQRRLASR
jgi:dTMP kinase